MEGRIFYDDVENGNEDSVLCGRRLGEPADAAIALFVSRLPAVPSSPAVSAHRVSFRHPGLSPEILSRPAVYRVFFHPSLRPQKSPGLILLFPIFVRIFIEEEQFENKSSAHAFE
jgi:hypothetical protein